jgi:hypothetical protein
MCHSNVTAFPDLYIIHYLLDSDFLTQSTSHADCTLGQTGVTVLCSISQNRVLVPLTPFPLR